MGQSIDIPTSMLQPMNLRRTDAGYMIDPAPESNIYHMTVGRHLGPESRDRPAMLYEQEDGSVQVQSFADIDAAATNLAAKLRSLGYGRGALVGIHTGQSPDTGIAHMAVCKIGGVAVTLSQLYGPDTLRHAMNDCQLPVILTTGSAWAPFRDGQADQLPTCATSSVATRSGQSMILPRALLRPRLMTSSPTTPGAMTPRC